MPSAEKIKICHLTTVHPPFDTRIFFKECLSLSQDYDVHLIAQHIRDEQLNGVTIHALKAPISRIQRFLQTGPQLFLKALKLKARIYHFHDPEIIPWALLIKIIIGAEIIYDVHENVALDLKEKDWLKGKHFMSTAYMRLEKLTLKYFNLVLAEKSYIEYYKNRTDKYILVQNFVQPQYFTASALMETENKNTLLLVGNLGARRGLAVLLDALLLLKNTGVKVNLYCVGNKNEAVDSILLNSASYNEIKSQVTFAGYKPLPNAYDKSNICFAGVALPEKLENHTSSYPTKLFEYMAAGLPVICSDFPVNRAVIDECGCGICVDPENVEEVADAIAYLKSAPKKAANMGDTGRKAVAQNYNWHTEEVKLLQLYKNLLE